MGGTKVSHNGALRIFMTSIPQSAYSLRNFSTQYDYVLIWKFQPDGAGLWQTSMVYIYKDSTCHLSFSDYTKMRIDLVDTWARTIGAQG